MNMTNTENITNTEAELVKITVDGKEVRIPRGTNLIEAALSVGIEIPFYCYHKHLSIAGNCRMCQVKVEGAPKLTIGCNTGATEGMVVYTHETSSEVADAQRATLEFLLINHPLDCTVCDQAGHCKLQDYYYEYNRKASRFLEEKVEKVKAEVLGPEVIYDGERCIVCTRCVRFCDEVTGTGELSVLNRGDRTVIAVNEDKPLDNPFSGVTVDLCPVGALTHRRWRFNSRIWYSGTENSICTGCSTGCNVRVAVRDDKIVQVKGRLNSEVNQEWLCDEGRYGFDRFQPKIRVSSPLIRNNTYLEEADWDSVYSLLKGLKEGPSSESAVFISPFLTTEEIWLSFRFAKTVLGIDNDSQIALPLRKRKLTELESILVSPDYAPNARAAQFFGYLKNSAISSSSDWRTGYEAQYDRVLEQIRAGIIKKLVLIGYNSVLDEDLDDSLVSRILEVPLSLAITPRGLIGQSVQSDKLKVIRGKDNTDSLDESLGAHQLCNIILPSQTVHEKNGVMFNRDLRLQRLSRLIAPPVGVYPEWVLISRISRKLGKEVLPASINDERALFNEMIKDMSSLGGSSFNSSSYGFSLADLKLRDIGEMGISFENLLARGNSEIRTESAAKNLGA
ncbi:MAG TPA: 2Fe-2S iron-sulfur cluster-binding protein [Oligoflexia bacterium]|nr:2Fe-2S iron-sulfur cluster-binding protein [Oligoflexia bacterium]HMP47890.1 2Fe-2S iron-sulfur cluster-binding protein [Oligoflexia bacterium]